MVETGTTGQVVDWGDETVSVPKSSGKDLVKFRLKLNEVARAVVMDETAYLAMSHYNPDPRRYIRCIKEGDNTATCPACVKLGPPKQRFGANVLRYKSDNKGEAASPVEWELQLWTFGPDKFTQLRSIKQEWGDLRRLDLKILCKDETFQNMVITTAKNCLWLDETVGITQAVAEDYKENKFDIERIIGKVYSAEEITKLMNGEELDRRPENAPSPEVVAQAVADIEKELATVPEATSGETVNFDDLLSDLGS